MDDGVGGGPGLGYRQVEGGACAYLGAGEDGWIRLAPTTALAVEAVTVGGLSGKAAMTGELEEEPKETPRETTLLPAAPNPANPSTRLHFTLAQASDVAFVVYNQRGAKVKTLYQGSLPAGEHLLKWRGRDDAGGEVSSGVYFVKMVLPGRTFSQRVTIVR